MNTRFTWKTFEDSEEKPKEGEQQLHYDEEERTIFQFIEQQPNMGHKFYIIKYSSLRAIDL